jgi:4'-phosphopantetheinyl transferase
MLSEDEKARADRFHFEIDRAQFIVARGWLRTLLGHYLEINPARVCFEYEKYGKPKVANSLEAERRLHFNLAHARDLALYAFTYLGPIGIDLEYVQPDFIGDDIAERWFSASEVMALNNLPAETRRAAFFNCWTRKEAFIKAKGNGLSLPLDQFDVTLVEDEPAAVLRTRWDEKEAARWSMRDVRAGQDYVGAVAVDARDFQLSQWQVNEEILKL